MVFDGMRANTKFFGNLLVLLALGDHAQYLPLVFRYLIRQMGRGGVRTADIRMNVAESLPDLGYTLF